MTDQPIHPDDTQPLEQPEPDPFETIPPIPDNEAELPLSDVDVAQLHGPDGELDKD